MTAREPVTADKEGPLLTLVVAVAENGVIGVGGDLAWRISDDLRWFKRVTLGKPVVMGRTTFDSIGKPLPGRDNIVVSRNPEFRADGVVVARSLDVALAEAASAADRSDALEICVIGGAEIYAQAARTADRIYYTHVNAAVEGDVYFPQLKMADWRKIRVGGAKKSEVNEFACEFYVFDRLCQADAALKRT
ncbi:MAG: dihydrofolate reductase [Pseudomonadota bacterium]